VPELTFEEELETWGAPKIGELLHQLSYADMLPGEDRERSRALLAAALRGKETP
jgi:hypothetical protein